MRNDDWEAAAILEPYIDTLSQLISKENVANMITALYLFEGKLLYAVGKLDMRDVVKVTIIFEELDTLVHRLAKSSKVIKIVLPR